MSLRIRRGTDTQRTGIVFDAGELIYTTNTKRIFVGDGVTSGGTDPVKPLAGNGLIYNDITTKLDVSLATFSSDSLTEGANNKYFTNQRAQDAFGALVANGTFSGVTVQYDSVAHALNITVAGDYDAVVMDTNPQLGGNLSLNNHNIGGIGNISIAGNITANAGGTTVNTTITVAVNSGGTSSSSFTVASGTGILTNATFLSPPSNVTGQTLTVTGVVGNVVSFTPAVSFTPNMILPYSVSFTNVTGGGGSGGNITATTITATTGLGANLSLNGYNLTGTGTVSLNVTSNFQTRALYDGVSSKGYYSTTVNRGSFSSPTAVNAGDELGGLIVKGYSNSSTSAIAGIISFIVDPTAVIAGGNYIKSIVAIAAATDTSQDISNTFTLDSAGVATSNAFVASKYTQLAVYANDAARTSAIPTPAKGMMVFMSSGTLPAVTNKAVIYNGSAWAVMPG
jgi:hypothetical protein